MIIFAASQPKKIEDMDKNSKAPAMQAFRESLRKHNLKVTPQRIAVHEAMLHLGHASADMVTDHIKEEGNARVTVASVYNILTQMTLLGIYRHRMSDSNKMFFDVNTFNHMHLYDTTDSSYVDVNDEDLFEEIERKISGRRFRGYKVDAIDINIIVHPSTRKKR